MILSETQERFVKAIAAQVPLEQIVEIHFFQPIRQGGVESGVAVIATRPERPAASTAEATANGQAELPSSHPERSEESTVIAPTEDQGAVSIEKSADELAMSVDASEQESANANIETLIDDASPVESSETVEISQAELDIPRNVDSGELPPPANVVDSSEMLPPEVEVPPATSVSPSNERHVIYTARYRLTLKGLDRGKWETNVVAEADAPLLTVDAVVRGVQRRSGDVEDPIRLSGEELIAITRRTQHPAA